MSSGPSSGIHTPVMSTESQAPRTSVQIVPSCDVSACLGVSVKNLKIPTSAGSVYFKAHLKDKKCAADSKYTVVESICSPLQVQVSRVLESTPMLNFSTELKYLSPYSVVEIEVWEYSSRAVILDHSTGRLGSIEIPVFSPRGLLISGHHLRFFCSQENLNFPHLIDQFHVATLTENEPDNPVTDWNLPVVTPSSILAELFSDDSNELGNRNFITIDFSLSDGLTHTVYYSDSFKPSTSSGHLMRMNSGFPSFNAPNFSPLKDPSIAEPPSILSNWMVINGPIHTSAISRKSTIPGTGFIPTTDVASAISPCPVQVVDYELFKDHPAALKAHKIHRQNGLRVPEQNRRAALARRLTKWPDSVILWHSQCVH